ncbi:redox-regulated ATPase YchF [Candidatus Campbellbacteria bacterium]|nr:MAG: redox-regulated ATPase YchF [Candidatus Campbellbacteria bacterium]
MSLKVGIVGLPNVGKSTLFNALTKKSVDAQNYPFCTIDPSVGVVEVPDERLHQLAEMAETEKTVPAIVEFVDIAGLVKGASKGEGLGNQFLANIRDVDSILHVSRIFEDPEIIHVEGRTDPKTDIEIINLELIEADKQVVEKRMQSNEKDLKRNDADAKVLDKVLKRCQEILNDEKFIIQFEDEFSDDQKKALKGLQLLTNKPILYALNKDFSGENVDSKDDGLWDDLMNYFAENDFKYIVIDGKTEGELNSFSPDEKTLYKEELGADFDGIDVLIKKCYSLLGLISYFTVGKAETRAWTVKDGSTAPEAGTAIHNDFKDKFIRAEVIDYKDLLACGSKKVAREKGLLRTEGKEYIVRDGDVIEFLI